MRRARGRSLVGVWAIVTMLLGLGPCAAAESSLDAIRARGALRVGVKADAPPFSSLDARGRPVGFEVELARFFARVLFEDDTRAELVPVTTATRFGELEAGRVDLLLATVTATDERRKVAELSDSYFISASLILVPADSRIEGLGDLAGRRVAVVRGSIHEHDVADLQSRALLRPVGSVGEGVRAIKTRQADAFVYDDVVLLGLARDDRALRVTGAPIGPRPYVAAARKGDLRLIRWVNGWLAKMRRDGTYAAMWRPYFGPFESRLAGN